MTKRLKSIVAMIVFVLFLAPGFVPSAYAASSAGIKVDTCDVLYKYVNATVKATISNPSKKEIKDVGITVTPTPSGKQASNLSKTYKLNYCLAPNSSISVSFDFKKDLKLALEPSMQYSVSVFATINGKKYTAGANFTTPAFSVPYYTGLVDAKYPNGIDLSNNGASCYICCIAMAIKALGRNVTPYDIWIQNGEQMWITKSGWESISKKYEVSFIGKWTDLSGNKTAKKDELIKALKSVNANERVLLVQVTPYPGNPGDSHVVLAYLKNDSLVVNDPYNTKLIGISFEKIPQLVKWGDAESIWNNVTWYCFVRNK